MLSLYGSFTVPGVPHVVIYRDDEKTKTFYMASARPEILRAPAADGGKPLIELIAYLRDLDALSVDEDQIERGHMQLTVGLEVSQADQNKIRAFLRQKIRDESRRGYMFLGRRVRLEEPTLSYAPLYVGGVAEATTFDEELQIAANGECPILNTGVNAASFSYGLTQSGARFMKQALDSGAFPITVFYKKHMMVARIPAITIRIEGDRREFWEEVKSKAVTKTYTRQKRVSTQVGGFKFVSVATQKKVVRIPPSFREFHETFHNLKVTIDDGDFRNADPSDDTAKMLEELAFTVLENNILPNFFEPALPADDEDEFDEDTKGRRYWVDEEKEFEGTIDVTFERSDVVQIEHAANGMIGGSLTEQEIKDAVTVLDLSKPITPVHRMKVHPNVNFDTDPIFAVKVLYEYKEMDEMRNPPALVTWKDEAFFQAGDTTHGKIYPLAQAADGSVKHAYRYRTIVTMQSSSSAEAIHFPKNGWINATDENLVISYKQFGHVKIDFLLSSMPEAVQSVEATVTYPGSNLPGAVQTLHLNRETPTGSYLLNTGSTDPIRPYRVQLTYVMDDETRISREEFESTALVQTITSPFEDRQETTFIARGNFEDELSSILVTAKYADPDNDLEEQETLQLDAMERSKVWAVRQIDKTRDDFTYTVRVARRDGSDSTTQHSGVLGDVITVGPAGSDSIEVMVDAGLVDWSKYARVLVTVDYHDAENDVHHNKMFRFAAMSPELETWRILIADPEKRDLVITKRYIGMDPADSVSEDPVTTADPFILLREPVVDPAPEQEPVA